MERYNMLRIKLTNMKYIFLLLFTFPFIASSQTVKLEKIEKGVAKILVKNSLNASDNYRLVLKTMIENDIYPDVRDSALFYIKTQSKDLNKSMGQYFLNIIIKDNEIMISGKAKPAYTISISPNIKTTDDYSEIYNTGMGGPFSRTAFDKMNEFANKFSGDKVYKKTQ
jgi:hypothetical protein